MSKPTLPPAANQPPLAAEAPTVPWERVERFMGQFTHDIRNGLNAIELQLTFLSEISTDPEALTEIKQLRGTLGEVSRQLQAVKLKTSLSTVHSMEYPAGDFFEDLRERFERQHTAAVDRVQWRIATAGSLLVDPELSLAALLEILGNALSFAPERGAITFQVTAADTPGVVVNIGHDLAEPPSVPIEQWGLSPLLSTRRSAYGLGLFRARRILEAQGAVFEAQVTGVNATTTTVRFPQPAVTGS